MLVHGGTADNPTAGPKVNSTNETAIATTVPAEKRPAVLYSQPKAMLGVEALITLEADQPTMWHLFVYEMAIDGNWVADIEGRAEILWSEDFTEWGVGAVEFRHLRWNYTPDQKLHEWYAAPSLGDPIAKLIVPDIRRLFPILYLDAVKERAGEAESNFKAEGWQRHPDL